MSRTLTTVATLAERVSALDRFTRTSAAYLPADQIDAARSFVDRARTRLRVLPEHAVVALAGATGGGKSSLFNAVAGIRLSTVGERRPTTSRVHACVWGKEPAVALLDWLDVPTEYRFMRESPLDADDQAALRGLVLLDLPDFDSVQTEHRRESDRLLGLVDLVVWVLDPQKYADRVVHDVYLRQLAGLRATTIVVLNQTDRLSPADGEQCRADLARLVGEDGLVDAPVLATSAETGAGLGALRAQLEEAVAARHAALVRLSGDLAEMEAGLSALVAAPAPESVDVTLRDELAQSLAAAAGVGAAVAEVGDWYTHRAALPGWPTRPRDPQPTPSAAAAQPAQVHVAVQRLSGTLGEGLADPWSAAIDTAAGSHLAGLADELGHAVSGVTVRFIRRPWWSWLLGAVWWLALVVSLAGLMWFGAAWLRTVWHPQPLGLRSWQGVALALWMVIAGVAVFAVTTAVSGPLAGAGRRRAQARATIKINDTITDLAQQRVIAPVDAVLRDHAAARAALAAPQDQVVPRSTTAGTKAH